MNTYFDPLYGASYPSAKDLWTGFKSIFNKVAEAGYQPVAGHFDEYATDSPSHSPINDNYFNPGLSFLSPNPEDEFSPPSGKGLNNSGVPSSTFDYINAELAKVYGMDKSTAYQEALSNTAYQRAVADMQAAGLNPAALYGGGRGSAASGVGYVGEAAPGGSGSSAKGSFSAAGLSDVWNVVQSILPVVVGIGTMAATKNVSAAKKAAAFTSGLNAGKGVTSVLGKAFG